MQQVKKPLFIGDPSFISHGQPILVYAKPGVIHLRTFPSSMTLGCTSSHALALELQPVSSSSTPLSPVSGLIHYEQHDALLVSLFDGSFHMIHRISTSPSIGTPDDILSSEELTRRVRTVFAVSECKVNAADSNRTSCILDYDGSGSIGWLHECVILALVQQKRQRAGFYACPIRKRRPDDFSYKHDSQHASIYIIARLWMDETYLLEQLASQLTQDLNRGLNTLQEYAFTLTSTVRFS